MPSFRRPFSNAAKHGKSRKLLLDQLFPLDTAKETGKACLPRARPLNRHAGVWGRASPAQKFEAQLSQSRGKITQKKRQRRTKICSQQRPIGGRIRNKNTTINHINVSTCILGAHLCDSGWIGLLWLSWCCILSAALFCDFGYRLIVMNHDLSYKHRPIKLKLSHMNDNGIGQPRTYLYLTLQMGRSQERGSP